MTRTTDDERIFGLTWDDIVAMQNKQRVRRTVDLTITSDYGSDPIGDGTFRMIPSGDVVSFDERNRRLSRNRRDMY